MYALQMTDAFIRAGLYKRVLVVGAEIHSHSMDYSTRGRDVMVLFGDGAGAVVLGPVETDDPRAGVMYTQCGADGTGAWRPVHQGVRDREAAVRAARPQDTTRTWTCPQMDGKRVFLNAVRTMVMSTNRALVKPR